MRLESVRAADYWLDMGGHGLTISFMHTDQPDRLGSGHGGVTRRAFVGTTLAGGAALLTGGITSLFHASSATAALLGDDGPIIEATIPIVVLRAAFTVHPRLMSADDR